MIDARHICRKVTRKIYDFSPKQLQNLLAIVWLYRGQEERFLELVYGYLRNMLDEPGFFCRRRTPDSQAPAPLADYITAIDDLIACIEPFTETLEGDAGQAEIRKQVAESRASFNASIGVFQAAIDEAEDSWHKQKIAAAALRQAVKRLAPLAEKSRDRSRQADTVFKLVSRWIEICEKEPSARTSDTWSGRDIGRAHKAADAARQAAVEQLKRGRYFHKQAAWLTERFPDGALRDVEGLVKLVDRAELAANDFSLTPGRYVGVAPEEEDDGFDFEEALREIHIELEGLNAEAAELAARISGNFKELGI
jgi:type I restriction enzyme M protein